MEKRIFGQIGRLKKEKIEEYKALHANAWPAVLSMITECNLHNYSIFIQGSEVFAYFEYTGDDYEADMAKMAADPATREWWTHTRPCFERFSVDEKSEFYCDMQSIFYCE